MWIKHSSSMQIVGMQAGPHHIIWLSYEYLGSKSSKYFWHFMVYPCLSSVSLSLGHVAIRTRVVGHLKIFKATSQAEARPSHWSPSDDQAQDHWRVTFQPAPKLPLLVDLLLSSLHGSTGTDRSTATRSWWSKSTDVNSKKNSEILACQMIFWGPSELE